MGERLEDLTIVDYCDLDDEDGYVETSILNDEVDDAMRNPVTSILVEDAANPGVLLAYHLTSLVDAETNEVLAVVDFEEEEDTLH